MEIATGSTLETLDGSAFNGVTTAKIKVTTASGNKSKFTDLGFTDANIIVQ